MTSSCETDTPFQERLLRPVTARWFFVVMGTAICYAVLRYHIVGDIPWSQFPLFVMNKATALAAVIFLSSAYLIGKIIHWHDGDEVQRRVVVKFCGLAGFFLGGVHSFFSLGLWSPAYYSKYFGPDGHMNLQGQLSIVFGVLALFILLAPAISTLPAMSEAIGGRRWRRSQQMGYLALVLLTGHLIALGGPGWINVSLWQGRLPPISLIAAVVVAVPVGLRCAAMVSRRLAFRGAKPRPESSDRQSV